MRKKSTPGQSGCSGIIVPDAYMTFKQKPAKKNNVLPEITQGKCLLIRERDCPNGLGQQEVKIKNVVLKDKLEYLMPAIKQL